MFINALLLAHAAWAVPGQFTHQGRILDAEALPIDGDRTVTYRLLDAAEGGATVWEESLEVSLTNGFYSAVLGSDEETNPLDLDVLDQAPLWLELQLAGEPPMYPRHAVQSVPYAAMAGTAEDVEGGVVNASEVSIDGTQVIDADGQWVGELPPITWTDIAEKPEDIEDPDTVLSAEEVLAIVTGSILDLGADSSMNGVTLATLDDIMPLIWEGIAGIPEGFADGQDDDALTALSIECGDGDAPHWEDATMGWVCTEDQDSQLSMAEVLAYVTDAAIDLAEGTTIGGLTIAAGEHTTTLDWSAITGVPDSLSSGSVPSGTVIFFNGETCPEGYTELLDGQGRYLVGRTSDGRLGASVGSALADEENRPTGKHDHSVNDPGHSHTVNGSTSSGGSGAAFDDAASGSQSTSGSSTGVTVNAEGTTEGTNAPYLQLTICERD